MKLLATNDTLKVAGGCDCALQKHFGDSLIIHWFEPALFNDTSLGLPEPGMMYLQVITPGSIVHGTLNGEPITIHVAYNGYFKVAP